MTDSRRVGILALVEVGVTVWSTTRRDHMDSPLGGVVVALDDFPDEETGEVERFFVCLDPYGAGPVKVRRIAESEITASTVEATASARITNLVRRLAKEVSDIKGSYLDHHHAERVRWMHTLTGIANLAA